MIRFFFINHSGSSRAPAWHRFAQGRGNPCRVRVSDASGALGSD
jgi:hypothetical protein